MKHSVHIVLWLVVLFLAAQYVGLFVVNQYIDYPASKEAGTFTASSLPPIAGQTVDRPQMQESQSPWFITGAIIVGTIIILLLMRWRAVFVWKAWFFLAALLCLYFSLYAFLKPIAAAELIALIAAIVLAAWKVWRPNLLVQNFTEVLLYGGLAAIFFSVVNITAMLIILFIISLYDMYAVWASKHMVALARFQASSGMFAGLLLPYASTEKEPKRVAKVMGQREGIRTAVLGGGDIGFPLLFAASVLKQYALAGQGWLALLIPPFVALALFLLLWYGKKDRFYPAMPFLSAGCLVGLAVVQLVRFL